MKDLERPEQMTSSDAPPKKMDHGAISRRDLFKKAALVGAGALGGIVEGRRENVGEGFERGVKKGEKEGASKEIILKMYRDFETGTFALERMIDELELDLGDWGKTEQSADKLSSLFLQIIEDIAVASFERRRLGFWQGAFVREHKSDVVASLRGTERYAKSIWAAGDPAEDVDRVLKHFKEVSDHVGIFDDNFRQMKKGLEIRVAKR